MICAMYLVLVKEVECSKYPKIIIDCIHPQDNCILFVNIWNIINQQCILNMNLM